MLASNGRLDRALEFPILLAVQTSLHIRSLVQELNREIIGGEIVRTAFYRKLRAAYFFVDSESANWAFGFVFHPGGSGVFLVAASKIEVDTTEKPWPIFDLAGAKITKAEQIGLDRLFRMHVKTASGTRQIVCEAIGPNGNLWFLDDDDKIIATLRHREHKPHELYKPMPPREGLDPVKLTAGQLKGALDKLGGHAQSAVTFVEKQVLGFNRTLAREAAIRAGIERASTQELKSDQIAGLALQIRTIAESFTGGNLGYLHKVGDGVEVLPFKLRESGSVDPDKYKTLSLAVMSSIAVKQDTKTESDESKVILAVTAKQVERLRTRLEKVGEDLKTAGDFERYKQLGDLLHSNFTRIKRGLKHLRVENTFGHRHEEVDIPLDPALSPKQNVENYYKKHRKGKEGLELLERRHEITEQELSQWRDIHQALTEDFDSARQRYQEELSALLPKERVKTAEVARLPYREVTLSTGLTIYVGRDGADNDRTTFEFAKPYELWFHAQQCPGSHVVMKFPNKSFAPSKREIEETAAITAFHSKAKNNSAVPVIYTERRYVRKPRKAKPGLVTVEKEKSLMVVPRKPAGGK
jgi:predicted ribosome quality control (RQC) complex YloA/Tae2 family protein